VSRIVKLFFVALLISVVSCIKANPDPEKRQTRSSFTFTSDVANTSKSGTKAVRLLGVVTKSSDLGIYGGDLKFKEQATRFFHTQKINGVWFLIDPDGYRFFTVGVNSVSKGGGILLPDFLRNIGVNTLGCWSDETIIEGTAKKMAYCPRWNFLQTYKNLRQRTKDLYEIGIIPVFDPDFITFCDNHAKQLESLKNDFWIMGHFSDNELPLYDNTTYGKLLDRFLAIADKTDSNFLAAQKWMVTRQGVSWQITDADRADFHGFVAGTYYKIVNEAIKRYDPNHLYLGSRLHGGAKSKPAIFREAGKYVDLISINVYDVWTPDKSTMDMWSGESGKPFFVTEFYAKAEDSKLSNAGGAGWLVPTQTDRAKFFENFTLALIEHPGCAGFHYFRYMDDDSNKGLIDQKYKWWIPMHDSFYKIARDIYNLRDFMNSVSK
jgi:hypothetical protein